MLILDSTLTFLTVVIFVGEVCCEQALFGGAALRTRFVSALEEVSQQALKGQALKRSVQRNYRRLAATAFALVRL